MSLDEWISNEFLDFELFYDVQSSYRSMRGVTVNIECTLDRLLRCPF